MGTRPDRRRLSTASLRGYTLMEMLTVILIMGVIGLTTSVVIMESMKVYARTVPGLDASYQARMATEWMKREIRDMDDTASITVFTATALTFDNTSGDTIAYDLTGSDLTRNGDLLAQGVTALTFTYWKDDGTTAAVATDLALVEIDLTVETRTEPYRVQNVVTPRYLRPRQ